MYNQAGLCLKHRYGYYTTHIYEIYYMLHVMFIYIFKNYSSFVNS